MPSPFPGMDPYLEDPAHWPDLHHRMISSASDLLVDQLRPRYLVRIEERVYVSDDGGFSTSGRPIVPDLHIAPGPSWQDPGSWEDAGTRVIEPMRVTTLIETETREPYLQILDREDRSIVAVIEILSPANKVVGSRGADSFEQKRWEVMHSRSHWVEIDLLRRGHSLTPRHRVGPLEYLVHVSRVEDRPEGWIWPIRLFDRLPTVAIPLRAGDPDVKLRLQQVLDTAYDRGAYDLVVDYRSPPAVALVADWNEWADRLLRERGLRS